MSNRKRARTSSSNSNPPDGSLTTPEKLEGTFRFKVNLSALRDEKQIESPSHSIGGFEWTIQLMKRSENDSDFLSFFIGCETAMDCDLWFCRCKLTYRLLNARDHTKDSHQGPIEERYSGNEGVHYGYHKFSPWKALMNPEKGFVTDDCFEVEAVIEVKSTPGTSFREKADHDFLSSSRGGEVILVVEKKEFHVAKQLLAIHSTFFNSLFYNNHTEKNQKKISLRNVSEKEMTCVLDALHRLSVIDKFNYIPILKVADMYSINILLDDIEKFLMETEQVKLETKIGAADNYRLHTLLDVCLSKITTAEAIVSIRETPDYKSYSGITREKIFDLHIQLSRPKQQ